MIKIPQQVSMTDPSSRLLSDLLGRGERRVAAGGLQGSTKAFVLADLFRKASRTMALITGTENEAREAYGNLSFFLGADHVFLFPPSNLLSTDMISFQKEATLQRMEILARLSLRVPCVAVASVRAILQKSIPRAAFEEYRQTVSLGDVLDRDELMEKLQAGGYNRVPLVEEKGEFSVRGSIVDIFPPLAGQPLRLEFMGDELESIRTFDPTSQRSVGEIVDFMLTPATEIILTEAGKQRAAANIKKRARELELSGLLRNRLIESVAGGSTSQAGPMFLPLFYEGDGGEKDPQKTETPGVFFDYLPGDSLLVLDDESGLKQAAKQTENDIDRAIMKYRAEETFYLERETSYITEEQFFPLCGEFPLVYLEGLKAAPQEGKASIPYVGFVAEKGVFTANSWKSASQEDSGALGFVASVIRKRLEEGYLVIFLCAGREEGQRMAHLLAQYELFPQYSSSSFFEEIAGYKSGGKFLLLSGRLSEGFHFPSLKLYVTTEEDLFGRKISRRRTKPPREGYFLRSFGELNSGDFVVHTDHGIGLYRGLQKLAVNGLSADFLLLEYQDADKLYIPVDRLERIQRYAGPENFTPQLDKLGGSSWNAVKDRIKKSVREIAEELVAVHAARQVIEGTSFSLPQKIYDEFCAGFEFEETPDQAKAIEEVELDLMDKKPMDRLICGDAGFGKTEVALRAAFIAAMNGKQVALLVPTTLLAEQHYQTFVRRLADWPLNVAVMNRFRTKTEQRRIAGELREGKVDIAIGTHRLLQKDIGFKELGLVIIDEEQRFGVVHKEKLKKLRTLVDVLTLTATPIPRTLHLSMSGIRDLSVINTPPDDRHPVKTYVAEFDEEIIKGAIQRELTRGGGVFLLHDRIRSIYTMARLIEKLVPGVKVGVVHGRMKAEEVEKTMGGFVNGDCHVLVCTTIIGTGLDIPSANTIIINRADRFGLAQLYQIRGRVGRGREEGIAYLLIPKGMMLSRDARKRLQAISDFSEPGSGFRISYQDLEIRGAGNILGISQSGHISAVGYELYTELMEQTIRELKGEGTEKRDEKPEIHLGIQALIPEEYMTDVKRRLITYKRLSLADSEEELRAVKSELIDCYGFLPPEVSNLMEVLGIRNMLHRLGGRKMVYDGKNIVISFHQASKVEPARILDLSRTAWPGLKITPDLRLFAPIPGLQGEEIIKEGMGLVRALLN